VVEPMQTVAVTTLVTGVLFDVAFHEGDFVKAGDILFHIDPRPLEAEADQARANLAKDEAQLIAAQNDDARYQSLAGKGYVTQSDADQHHASALATAATVNADRATLRGALLNLEHATIRSPISGRTGSLIVRPGNVVSPTGGPLVVINQLRQAVERAAPTNARILITGAPGSGKELTARTVRGLSTRASSPFVVVSAATITPETMEAELFGTESGAGGARRVGALEEAHGGTLYIDEIADMPRETQSRILRVLVDQNFQRVGGTTRVHVDVRIVSSSSRDLPAEIAAGRFREDLFHRLGVIPIRVPSLSERREDVPELIEFFMDQISSTTGLPKRRIAEDAMAVLQSHDWPGNVRQLRNNVERLMILSSGDPEAEITADMLPSEIGALVPSTPGGAGGEKLMSLPLREAREIFEREYLLAQIARFSGNISRTAEFIGMERSALHRKLKSLGIGG